MNRVKSLVAAGALAIAHFVNTGAIADTPINIVESHTRSGDESNVSTFEFEPQCQGSIVTPDLTKSQPGIVRPPQRSSSYPLSLPEYPAEAKRIGAEGTVMVKLFVTEQGFIAKAQIAKTSGFQSLDDAAVQGTRYWRFVPGRIAETSACMWVAVPVVFKLPKDLNPPSLETQQ